MSSRFPVVLFFVTFSVVWILIPTLVGESAAERDRADILMLIIVPFMSAVKDGTGRLQSQAGQAHVFQSTQAEDKDDTETCNLMSPRTLSVAR